MNRVGDVGLAIAIFILWTQLGTLQYTEVFADIGRVDPGALVYLLRERGLSVDELDAGLEHESGLAALGGLDDPLAFAVYTYRIAGAVAHMAMALSGIDVLAFSGGVGENRADVRDAIAERLAHVGYFATQVVTAREDLVIARAVRDLVG